MNQKTNYTETIAQFVSETNFGNLPREVITQSKRIILDTVGCALGGFTTDKGRICRKLALSLGGTSESTILGTSHKISCTNASFANSNMANALDNDDCFKNLPHFAPSTVCSALAIAEKLGANGKELIAAVALGYDIAARVGSAAGFPITIEDNKIRHWQNYGFNWEIFGPAIASAKLSNLDIAKAVHVIGIAGNLAPAAPLQKFLSLSPLPMVKYIDAGWIATSGVMAALLAEDGYTGPENLLDPDYKFWRTFGAEYFNFKILTDELGKYWYIMDSSIKPWPSCRHTHHPLTLFLDIIRANNFTPGDIERVTIKGSFLTDVFTPADPTPGPIGPQFNIPHAVAMVAFDIPPGPRWHHPEILNNPRIREFRRRVFVEHHERTLPSGRDDNVIHTISEELPGFFTKAPTTVEVVVNGATFSKSGEYAKGDPYIPETRMSNEALKEKFRLNATDVMFNSAQWQSQIEEAANILLDLENLASVRDLTSLLEA